MLYNFLKIAIRSLWKNRAFSTINVLGLGMSLGIAVVIYLIVNYHFSFDDYRRDRDRIYRLFTTSFIDGTAFPNPGVSVPLFKTVPDEISGIEETTPIVKLYADISIHQAGTRKNFKHGNKIIFTNTGYFKILDYTWLAGSPQTLSKPFNVVLTKNIAGKLYGPQDDFNSLIGNLLIVNDSINLRLSGVVEEPQKPTEFIFNVFISLPSFYSEKFNIYRGWRGVKSDNQLLIKLQEGVTPESVEKQFPAVLAKHLEKENPGRIQGLQPISELHFNSDLTNLSGITMVKFKLYAISFIAFFLLLLACFNFINLTTSTGLSRVKEVVLRKSLGSNKTHLMLQQLTETLIVFTISTIVCLFFVAFIIRGFRDFIPVDLTFDSLWDLEVIFPIVGLIFILALITGFFPVVYLVKVGIRMVSNGNADLPKIRMGLVNQIMVIFQFTITFFLIIATLFIYKQTQYSISKDLGFNPEGVLTFRSGKTDKDQNLKDELTKIPEAKTVSLASYPPIGQFSMSQVFKYKNENGIVEILAEHKDANQEYMDIYQFNILAGSGFQSNSEKECLINQRFLQELGIVEPNRIIGSTLSHDDGDLTIVGIVKDFHFQKTEHPIGPLVIKSFPVSRDFFHIKLADNNRELSQTVIQKCQLAWEAIYPDKEFRYVFLEDDISNIYNSEKTASLFLFWASVCTIFLSCMGILGLAIFSTNRKIKEIGIRKVNGAKVIEILTLLNKDFVKWVVIAFFIATPIAWYAMSRWLENFAYKTELSWWVFALAGLLALGIALLTVSWQSWKAATRNPVEALRYE
ncbi:MAG: FtsX-like permease family protein [Cyclobacteriaceae bacterium]